MTPLFADTSFFIAPLSDKDDYHQKALFFAENVAAKLVTSIWVLVETGDALSHRLRRNQFERLLSFLNSQTLTEVIPVDQSQYSSGLDVFEKRRDKDWSLTDCIAFQLMRERGMNAALTSDHHFIQAGFRALLLEN